MSLEKKGFESNSNLNRISESEKALKAAALERALSSLGKKAEFPTETGIKLQEQIGNLTTFARLAQSSEFHVSETETLENSWGKLLGVDFP